MKNAIISELADTWELQANMVEATAERRECLRECVDTLRSLLTFYPEPPSGAYGPGYHPTWPEPMTVAQRLTRLREELTRLEAFYKGQPLPFGVAAQASTLRYAIEQLEHNAGSSNG